MPAIPKDAPPPANFPNSPLVSTIYGAFTDKFDGRVDIWGGSGALLGSLFFYEGRAYASEISGFSLNVCVRLVSAGLMQEPDLASLGLVDDQDAGSPDPQALDRIYRQVGIDIDAIVEIHQEFFAAAVGALLLVPGASITREPDVFTAVGCTLPIGPQSLLDLVEVRHRRLALSTSSISFGDQGSTVEAFPGSVVLAPPTQSQYTIDSGVPEVRVFLSHVDGIRTLDQVARLSGITRAEAFHITEHLLDNLAVTFMGCAHETNIGASLEVPEQCVGAQWSTLTRNVAGA